MRSSLLAEAYLTFPVGEEVALRGMQWSHDGDAIEDANCVTVCLVEQLQEVLRGAFAGGSVPHFSHLMHLMWALRFGSSHPAIERFRRAYAECSTTAALGRNTGAFIAHLCSGFALILHPPTLDQVLETIAARRRNGLRNRTELKLYVAMPIAEAAPKLAAQIAALSDDQLRHWFRFGGSSLPPDERVAEELESLPQRVLRLIAAARTSPRLVGAASLIPALDAGLTIPPRKKSPDAVPQGGYADVTTRGDPDRLLPSQFALDPDEFVRRFAERELLYFQREEPHETQKPERVLVFDQGVRTWGRVRLALAGAVLSLLKYDARRIGDARLYVTSQPEMLPLRTARIEDLQEVLEASDFSTNPCEAFRHAVEEAMAGGAPRDLIVLTHLRNAPALLNAAELRQPGDRIFTLTVDEEGIAKLAELRDEGFVALRSFRLDLQAAAEEQVEGHLPATAKPERVWHPWTGDVEPIGFPFRPGLVADVDVLGFSAEGDWLVTASHAGVLHAIACDGSSVEVLPRGFKNAKLWKGIQTILPVNDGVVAVGPVVSSLSGAYSVSLAHYDLRRRVLLTYSLGSYDPKLACATLPEQHCVIAYQSVPVSSPVSVIDLRLEQVIDFKLSKLNVPAFVDELKSLEQLKHPLELKRYDCTPGAGMAPDGPYLGIYSNLLRVERTKVKWNSFLPRTNGIPFIRDASIRSVITAGETLAVSLNQGNATYEKLMIFRAPDGRISMELERPMQAPFTLSPDGELLARRCKRREIVIHQTAETREPVAFAYSAKLHDQLEVWISTRPFLLTVAIGGTEHDFNLLHGRLNHRQKKQHQRVHGKSQSDFCQCVAYDEQRFNSFSSTLDRFHAVTDKFGLVHLIANGTTLVASFCIRRELAAAWIPGGIFWGSAALIGGPPHPNGAELIGRAILDAGGAE